MMSVPFGSNMLTEPNCPSAFPKLPHAVRKSCGPRDSAGGADRCSSLPARHLPHCGTSLAGSVSAVGEKPGARGVRIQPEHVADVGERERPLATVGAHPGLGLGGQFAVTALASTLEAPCRLFQYGEHEGDRSGCVAHPLRADVELRGKNHHRFDGRRLKLVDTTTSSSFASSSFLPIDTAHRCAVRPAVPLLPHCGDRGVRGTDVRAAAAEADAPRNPSRVGSVQGEHARLDEDAGEEPTANQCCRTRRRGARTREAHHGRR